VRVFLIVTLFTLAQYAPGTWGTRPSTARRWPWVPSSSSRR
jgi:hypothetical protein